MYVGGFEIQIVVMMVVGVFVMFMPMIVVDVAEMRATTFTASPMDAMMAST
jgi:hypothetical protein